MPLGPCALRQPLQIEQQSLLVAQRVGKLGEWRPEAERVQSRGIDAERDHAFAGLQPPVGRAMDVERLRHLRGGQVAFKLRDADVSAEFLQGSLQ